MEGLWGEILPDDFLICERISRIYYKGKLYSYPVDAAEVIDNFGKRQAALTLASCLKGASKNQQDTWFRHDPDYELLSICCDKSGSERLLGKRAKSRKLQDKKPVLKRLADSIPYNHSAHFLIMAMLRRARAMLGQTLIWGACQAWRDEQHSRCHEGAGFSNVSLSCQQRCAAWRAAWENPAKKPKNPISAGRAPAARCSPSPPASDSSAAMSVEPHEVIPAAGPLFRSSFDGCVVGVLAKCDQPDGRPNNSQKKGIGLRLN